MPKRFDQARPFLTLALVGLAWLLVPVVVKTFTPADLGPYMSLVPPAGTTMRLRFKGREVSIPE